MSIVSTNTLLTCQGRLHRSASSTFWRATRLCSERVEKGTAKTPVENNKVQLVHYNNEMLSSYWEGIDEPIVNFEPFQTTEVTKMATNYASKLRTLCAKLPETMKTTKPEGSDQFKFSKDVIEQSKELYNQSKELYNTALLWRRSLMWEHAKEDVKAYKKLLQKIALPMLDDDFV